MEKLIVVGMRYHDPKLVKVVVDAAKQQTVSVSLKLEDNKEAPGGKALAVYYKQVRVGFVRNADLQGALANNSWQRYVYLIRSCATNYWILDGKPSASSGEGPSSYDDSIVNLLVNVGNPCGEISSGITTTSPHWANSNYRGYTKPQDTAANLQQANTNSTKDEKKMINTNSMRDSFFREVKNVAIDIQSGKFGVISNDGISVYTDGGVSVNPITDFGVKVPAFAMRVAVSDLKAGDIIVGNETTFFKQALKEGGYEVVTLNGEVRTVGTVTNMFFGKNSVLAVKNMFGEGTNPMMMAMMMGDNKEGFDMKTFALMSMMGNSAGNAGGMDQNMLMMLMLMGK